MSKNLLKVKAGFNTNTAFSFSRSSVNRISAVALNPEEFSVIRNFSCPIGSPPKMILKMPVSVPEKVMTTFAPDLLVCEKLLQLNEMEHARKNVSVRQDVMTNNLHGNTMLVSIVGSPCP